MFAIYSLRQLNISTPTVIPFTSPHVAQQKGSVAIDSTHYVIFSPKDLLLKNKNATNSAMCGCCLSLLVMSHGMGSDLPHFV
ncbi:DEHA2E06688p [Debaryomyces hansenii CBS767]|uniref:DEHA2E06688p n=1 Tax=Debaryomyces hansenii (strain ATCC 36239 / CBS 767 / BCRC 21394 / JCM 1990 / NBRC 0083 / IGC 2968) TaxID=284592 RepID=Q6BQC1_DEBHA|nr:DEHA2E06688p [Debaryomyces hansenii CBS767]CAG87829.2 DEHA2E06688p [Debaryomyces hansenii CBS767]|eukprot:XP_459599.2 DEHA2E06688p [Debaryomyces hansenii CBS767]